MRKIERYHEARIRCRIGGCDITSLAPIDECAARIADIPRNKLSIRTTYKSCIAFAICRDESRNLVNISQAYLVRYKFRRKSRSVNAVGEGRAASISERAAYMQASSLSIGHKYSRRGNAKSDVRAKTTEFSDARNVLKRIATPKEHHELTHSTKRDRYRNDVKFVAKLAAAVTYHAWRRTASVQQVQSVQRRSRFFARTAEGTKMATRLSSRISFPTMDDTWGGGGGVFLS